MRSKSVFTVASRFCIIKLRIKSQMCSFLLLTPPTPILLLLSRRDAADIMSQQHAGLLFFGLLVVWIYFLML